MIEEYLRAFEAHLVGSPTQKREWRAELQAHLREAAEADDLEGALQRLGSPAEAAAAFRAGSPLEAASPRRRYGAVLIDHVPVLVVVVAIVIDGIANHERINLLVPPPAVFGDGYSAFQNIVTALGLLWSYIGLALIEARTGRTPGKALMGLRTVSDDGTRLTPSQAFKRRVPILFGPLVWLDWAAAPFTPRRQRVFELLAHTIVIDDPTPKPTKTPRSAAAEPGTTSPMSRT